MLVDDDSWSDDKSPAWADSDSEIGTVRKLMDPNDALAQTDMDSGNDVVDWSRDNDHDVGVRHLGQLYHHHVVDDDHVIDDDPRDDDHGLGPKLDPVKSFLNLVSNHFVG